ncbi:MAG: hypothetical protein B5M53_08035 [Candidatus Cloacimonas sp. 4484_209]|nr:MAG: hypothetical protein B5M53_08035 [Candidatus Cloacimonas sp. 4484_209]
MSDATEWNVKMKIDKKVEKAINEFVEKAKRLGVEKIILYGSAIRGEYIPERSDIDILVISQKPRETYENILGVEFDIGLRDNILITTIVKSPNDFNQELRWGSPFLENVIKDGVTLYERSNIKTTRAG